MSPTCTNSHYDNHATFVPSINHNKDVALLSYVELYLWLSRYLECSQCPTEKMCQKSFKLLCHPSYCRKAAVVADD